MIIHIRHSSSIEIMRCKYYEFNSNTQRAIVMLEDNNPEWIYDCLEVFEVNKEVFRIY